MYERSVWFWNYSGGAQQAQIVADTGAKIAYIKAAGDRGIVWIPNSPTGGFARPQWDDGYLRPLTERGITCYPWVYNWPGDTDKVATVKALNHRPSSLVVFNPETEWRVASQHSPYSNLAAGNAYARAWVSDMRSRLPLGTRIGFSGVPSWKDFPYEGWAESCDVGFPQHYWHDELLGGENQVEAHYRRAPGHPCIPILTACREYDDAGVLRLAASALMHPIEGFSSWESGNSSWQADAMKQAYAMLPADNQTRAESPFIRAWKALWAA
jgi:hypothetical protein